MDNRLEKDLMLKVPVFHGLRVSEIRGVLAVSELTQCAPGTVLYSFGEPSRNCHVLLQGQLDIQDRTGVSVATLEPVQTVGEIGLITRGARTATVRAATAIRVMELRRDRLEELLETDSDLRAKLYRNFIRILGERLSDANDMVARYRRMYEEGKRRTKLAPTTDEDSVGESDESTDRDEARGTSPGPGPGAASEGPGSYNHVRFFFELLHRLPNPDDVEEGNRVIEALHGEGYSDADIDYTVKWTVRHIPGVQRFGMVQVCIKEALQEKWSI